MPIELDLTPEKPVVLQGENGLSQKADGAGHASYYYSIHATEDVWNGKDRRRKL